MTNQPPHSLKIPPVSASEKSAAGQADDSQSDHEVKQLSSGKSQEEIEAAARENEAARSEKFRDNFELMAILTLWIVWLVIVSLGLVWVYHLIAPPDWSQLPDAQVRNIQSIITGGVLAGIAGSHLKKRL